MAEILNNIVLFIFVGGMFFFIYAVDRYIRKGREQVIREMSDPYTVENKVIGDFHVFRSGHLCKDISIGNNRSVTVKGLGPSPTDIQLKVIAQIIDNMSIILETALLTLRQLKMHTQPKQVSDAWAVRFSELTVTEIVVENNDEYYFIFDSDLCWEADLWPVVEFDRDLKAKKAFWGNQDDSDWNQSLFRTRKLA